MFHESVMKTNEARLASFSVVYPLLKKKGSHSKGIKGVKWPHKSPTPSELAKAGFFYQPTDTSLDNTTCFLCERSLDGWESGDNAIVEHLKHAPQCGWAVNIAIELEREGGCDILENPSAEDLMMARATTFEKIWPHENKRGWTCKSGKMAAAGWFYCPTPEDDDFVRCAYCGLGMAGWEPKDDPYAAHFERSSDCKFFALAAPARPGSRKPKKSRVSKASRMSTQSTFTTVSEGGSIPEAEIHEDSSQVLPAVESEQPSKSTRGKKGGKPRKAPGKTKSKALNTMVDEHQQASSHVEPEDDDFEVKIEKPPAKKEKTQKRKSVEMDEDDVAVKSDTAAADHPMKPPPAKRRTTRASGSIMPTVMTSSISLNSVHGNGLEADNVENNALASFPAMKRGTQKGVKRGRKGASSAVRKASARSTAAMASPQDIIPSDDGLDAALEADLNRSVTENEAELEQSEIQYPKLRRLTRTRPGTRSGPASSAPGRRTRRSSSPPLASLDLGKHGLLAHVTSGNVVGTDRVLHDEAGSNSVATRSVSRFTAESVLENDLTVPDAQLTHSPYDVSTLNANDSPNNMKPIPKKARKCLRSRHPSRKLSKRYAQRSIASPIADPRDTIDKTVTTGLASELGEDESRSETNLSVIDKGPTRKRSSTKKRDQRREEGLMSSKPEDFIQHEVEKAANSSKPVFNDTTMDVVEKAGTLILSHDIEVVSLSGKVIVESVEPSATTPRSESYLAPPGSIEAAKAQKVQTPTKSPISVQPVDQTPVTLRVSEFQRQSIPLPESPIMQNEALVPSEQITPQGAVSPQSSDVENQPPSSRPSSVRPPLLILSPSKERTTRIPLITTPRASPVKQKTPRLESTMPWSAINYDMMFVASPAYKENNPFASKSAPSGELVGLTSPEKRLSLEEWIQFKAERGEEQLRSECERMIGKFEGEGVRALKTLEGIVCVD